MAIQGFFTDQANSNEFEILEGDRRLIRRGKIAAVGAAIALAPSSYGIPGFGTSYFADPSLKFRSFRIRPLGNGLSSEVDLIYSENTPGGSLPPPNRGETDYLEWTRRTEIQLVDLPYAVAAKRVVEGATGASTIYYWEPGAEQVENAVSVITLQLTIQATSSGISNLQAIDQQVNKIHEINGAKYLFQGGYVEKYSTDRYVFDYSWLVDRGTPVLSKTAVGTILAGGLRRPERPDNPGPVSPMLLDENPDGSGLIRDPYHVLTYFPNNGSPVPFSGSFLKPIGTVAHYLNPNYAEDLLGWQNLPGIGVIP